MKICLIMSASPTDALRGFEPFMPLSLPLLAATAPDHDYTLIDQLASNDSVDFERHYDLVGISMRMTAEAEAYRIADEFRKRGVPVVIGGPQATALPQRAKRHADAVAVGEGEALWPIIVSDAEREDLHDFYVCSPKPFEAGDARVFQFQGYPELAGLAQPLRKLYPKRYRFDTVFASRGCPINCDFCAVSGMYGYRARLRPVEEVVDEIRKFKSFYYLLDDSVFGRPSTYDYYLELYDALAKLPKKQFWVGQANLGAIADEKGREVIRRAVDAGFLYAMVGMESINPQVLEKTGVLRKAGLQKASQAVEEMKEQIAFLQDLGIVVSGWFTMGYDDDSLQTYYDTLRFCLETKVLPVLSPVNALPATPLYERLAKEGRLDNADSLTNYPQPKIPKEDIIQALRHSVDEGYSLSVNWKRLVFYRKRFRNVNGSSPEDRIKKTIFTAILQRNMPKILRREIDNLANEQSQNYYETEEERRGGNLG